MPKLAPPSARGGEYDKMYSGTHDWVNETARWWPVPMDVGPKPTGGNGYGLYEMSANVWEWVNDKHTHSDLYPFGDVTDPTGVGGSYYMSRAGDWQDASRERRVVRPNARAPQARSAVVGFRVCRTAH